MSNKITEHQESKFDELNKLLRQTWESLTPSERSRRLIFAKFNELQEQLRLAQSKNEQIQKRKNEL